MDVESFKKSELIFVVILLIMAFHVPSVYAEWTSVTPPNVSNDWCLNSVHFTSVNEGWAVGEDSSNDQGVLLHYYNGSWTPVTPPNVGFHYFLTEVHFTSPNEGWAVGCTTRSGVLLHYLNGSWTVITPPNVSSDWGLGGVHFTSPNEGWAVGTDAVKDKPVLLHYSSGSWAVVAPPIDVGYLRLTDVHFTSPNEGWAVGFYGAPLLHYSGSSWAVVTPPYVQFSWVLNSVHFTSANEGWAVGSDRYEFGKGALLHYSGGSWTALDFPALWSISTLFDVHFTSANEGWAVGIGTIGVALLHYSGGSWTLVKPPYVSSNWRLFGIHFTSANEGWAVGWDVENWIGVLLKYSTSASQYTLTVSKSGTGTGTVTSSPAGITCGSDCSEAYNQGTVVTLTATPSSGSTFTGWSGGCSGTGTCTVTMNANTTITATFTAPTPTQYTLTVSESGAGSGTVTSSPAGINCGSDCSKVYKPGTKVTLKAKANTGSTFTGWSGGGCSGTGTCIVVIDGDQSITATFDMKVKPLKLVRSNNGGILVNVHNPKPQSDGTVIGDLTLVNKTGTWYYVTSGGSIKGTIDVKIPSAFMLGPKDVRYYYDVKFNRGDNLIIEASTLGPAVAAVSMDIIIRGCFGWKLPNNAFDTLMNLFDEGMDQVKPELDALMQAILKKELVMTAKALANLIANVYARTPFVNILHVLLPEASFRTLGMVVEQGFQFLIDVIDLPKKIKLLYSLTKDFLKAPADGESIIRAE